MSDDNERDASPSRSPWNPRSFARRREASRQIREELERIRQAEARIAEALGSLRAARTRVEELSRALIAEEQLVREMVREELEAHVEGGAPLGEAAAGDADRGGVASLFGDAAGEADAGRDAEAAGALEPEHAEETRRSFWLVGVAAASVLAVAFVAWLAVQAFQSGPETQALTLGGDRPVAEEKVPGMPRPDETGEEPEDPEEVAAEDADRFFLTLPEPASQRAAVYDSLWTARSPLFRPLLERVAGATETDEVEEAIGAWEGTLTPLQDDLLRSALVQYVLREEVDGQLVVDGHLLRNPCRASSCSALLNLWESKREEYGLPAVPEDAPRNPTALRVAENVVVLRWLQESHAGGGEEAEGEAP